MFRTTTLALVLALALGTNASSLRGGEQHRRLSVPDPVSEIDYNAYVGRWYNVYYDKFTTLFSSPDCASAYYELDTSASVPTISVNNSGTDKGESVFLTGYVQQTDASQPADLLLHLEGVSQDATYRIIALGEKTYAGSYYQYSIVTDDGGLSLYVLARDPENFFATYDDEVTALLKKFGYTGFLWGVSKNTQDSCPGDIYYPEWNPVALAPPVTPPSVGASRALTVPEPVSEIDYNAYVGRWYNVYYDKFTTIFSSPDCASAYYELDASADVPTILVNNSGTDKGDSTFLTGYVQQTDASQPADLLLHLEGVSQDATYRIIALGEKTYAGSYYQYSIVTDDGGLSLYVLARDVENFFATYDDEVTALLEDFGYTGFIWGASKNTQDSCPGDIYYPAWEPNARFA